MLRKFSRAIWLLAVGTLLIGAGAVFGGDVSVMHTLGGDFANNGGQVRDAQLFRPFDVSVDPSGKIFIADRDISQIRVINTSGVISVFAGSATAGGAGAGGPATSAQLYHPFGVCAANGSVFVCDTDNHTVRKIDGAGNISIVAGMSGVGDYTGDHGPATSAALNGPWGLVVAADGTIYIAEINNHCIRKVDPGGTITTICGNGSPGPAVDGPAGSAQLNSPERVALDNQNHLLIADVGNSSLRQIDLGTMTITQRVATDVVDVATDGNGNVYFATDEGIYSLAANNSTTLIAGDGSYAGNSVDGPATATGIEPTSLCVTPAGTIYFTEETFGRLRTISGGVITTLAGGTSGDNGPATSATVVRVIGLNADSAGNIFLPDFHGNRIRKIAPNGIITTFAGTGVRGQATDGTALGSQIGEPGDVAFDSHGNVFFSEVTYGDIRKVDTSGNISTFATGIPDCYNLAIDSADNVYALSFQQCKLYKYTPGGSRTLIAGTTQGYFGDDGPATSAQFSLPLGLAVDTVGNIYIGDRGNFRVRKIDVGGTITTIAGTGIEGFSGDGLAATSAKLDDPRSVAVDNQGNVYIGDAQNARIRKITQATGKISTIVGTGVPGHTGDGGPGTSAAIEYPWGLWVDPAGSRLLFWDWNYFCVREWVANEITFGALPNQTYGVAPVTLTATASSGLPVSFTVTAGPASVNGNMLTITGAGSVTVQATQAGDSSVPAALPVSQTFTVNAAAATIALSGLAATFNGAAHAAMATTTPLGLSTSITYNGSTTAPTNAGSYAVAATITDPNYSGTATGTLLIAQAVPVITWAKPAAITGGTALSGTQLNASASTAGTFTYTPAAGTVLGVGNGQTLAVAFKPADSVNFTSATGSVAIDVLNATPAINSQPTATPNPATSGKPVSFAASAVDADGDALTYAWDFGDGATGAGSAASHTYTAPGTFNAVVTVTDAHGASVSASVAVSVQAATIPIDGGGTTLTDSNGDGIPDGMQAAADANGIATPAADVALKITKLTVSLNFSRANSDAIHLTGAVAVPAGFTPTGAIVIVDIGGVVRTFTLDKNGKAKLGSDLFTLTPKNGSVSVQFSKGAFASTLSGLGLTNANIKNAPVTVPIAILFGNELFTAAAKGSYSAKKDHTGVVK